MQLHDQITRRWKYYRDGSDHIIKHDNKIIGVIGCIT